MVYSYHLKIILKFLGKMSLDLPFYLYRSLGKISDKVQINKKGSETSLFHHGIIKLLVLEELRRLDRDWTSFLFINGYEIDVVLLRKPPNLELLHHQLWQRKLKKKIDHLLHNQ